MNIFTVIAVILAVWFILPVFTGQVVNIGNVTGVMCAYFLYRLSVEPAILKNPFILALFVFLIICLLISAVLTYGMIRTLRRKPKGNETLIILGCEIIGTRPSLMQVERLRAALKYLAAYPEMKVICSGGQGKKEKISEAEAMRKWLAAHGISEERIIEENRSETTEENLRYSLELIREKNLNPVIAICSNEFHLYRASLIAEDLGLQSSSVSAPTAWWLFLTFYVRELYALLYFMIRRKLKNS
ncbi:MAG: YdcF family protein [Solobacterium sp.]|nr:YdcF family protein [Solobacterium sp.]